MSALDEIRKKKNHDLGAIERLIVEAWECLDGREWMSDDAAEELTALRRVAEAARNHDLMAGPPSNRDGECYFCGGGVMHAEYCDYHKWRTELNAALAEYDKCRAA